MSDVPDDALPEDFNEIEELSDEEMEALFARMEEARANGDTEALDTQGMEMLMRAMAWGANRERTPEEIARDAARDEANRCEEAGDWAGAEAAHRHHLTLLTDQPLLAWKVWDDLRGLYGLLGRREDEWDAARCATEAARQGDMSPLLSNSLRSEGWLALECDDIAEAHRIAEEGMALTEDGMLAQQRPDFLLLRAGCALHEKSADAAEADLAAAYALLQPYETSMMMAGPVSMLRSYWREVADLRRLRGDTAGEVAACREAIYYARRIAEMPQLSGPWLANQLAYGLDRLGKALDAARDLPGAEEARAEARHLRRERHIPDPMA
jgi:hypothetical protein